MFQKKRKISVYNLKLGGRHGSQVKVGKGTRSSLVRTNDRFVKVGKELSISFSAPVQLEKLKLRVRSDNATMRAKHTIKTHICDECNVAG
jgi:hypothetical protein